MLPEADAVDWQFRRLAAGSMALTEDQTRLKAAIVAKWSILANTIQDDDVITLWNARYQHVDLLDGVSREDLQKASLHPAVLGVIKPAAGIDLPLQFQ